MVPVTQKQAAPNRRTDEWVQELCGQFSDATGWPLKYVAGRREHNAVSIVDSDCCWQADVGDGENLVGQLRLEVPHDCRADRSFGAVSQLSAIFAEMVGKVFTATHRLVEGTHELATLVHLGLNVPQGSELLVAVQQLLRAGLQLTGFRSACLFLLEPASEELRLRATHHLDARDVPQSARPLRSDPPDLHVMSSGTRIVIRRGDRQSDEWLPADAALGFCLPVQTPSGVMGTLWFFDRRPRSIESSEKQLLDSLGMQMASLLERAVLQRESATHQRLRQELLSLSDSDAESPIKTLRKPKLETAWRVGSRFEIGGDLCEAIELSDHEIAILIGDATGDSVPAAVVMTAVHGALAALLTGNPDEARDTEKVLERVNRALFRTRRLQHFMSLIYGVIDTQTLRFTYANAGHPTPLLMRDGEVITLDTHGLLLGIVEESEYTSETIELRPRDILVGFSDGISEARSSNAEYFGSGGVVRSLGLNRQEADAVTLVNRVWNQQAAFAVPAQGDDRSLLIARILPE